MTDFDVLIVGAGQGGAHAAIALRKCGFGGSIVLVGDEPELPYERPPLTKEYLSGEKRFEQLLIRPPAFWVENGIDLRQGRVVRVSPGRCRVEFADGAELGYRDMIWATGGSPRRLVCSGHDLLGVHTVRSRADVDRLVGELPLVERVVVIGGGYIGLESAAVLATLHKSVTVVEAQTRVLARIAGETLSRFYEGEHRRRGVCVRLGAEVECIEERDGRVAQVRLRGGELLPAELVIVGVGIVPAVEPLLTAGAEGGNGVRVDSFCRTSLERVYAIGDCALHANRFAGDVPIRLESVQNANDQALVAARAISGAPEPYEAVPWFWSMQYDLRLQTVGLSSGYDQEVVRGSPERRSFSVAYLKDRRVIALDCVNSPRDYLQGRALVAAGTICDPVALADVATPLKSLC